MYFLELLIWFVLFFMIGILFNYMPVLGIVLAIAGITAIIKGFKFTEFSIKMKSPKIWVYIVLGILQGLALTFVSISIFMAILVLAAGNLFFIWGLDNANKTEQ